MKSDNLWYVITGSSSSGKTTLVAGLAAKGHHVVYETARVYIDQEMAKGRTITDIRSDEQAFQKKALEMKIEIEKNLPKNEIVFLDRAIPDTIAYDRLYKYPQNPLLTEALKTCSYKKVFLLEQLAYVVDYARIETKKQQDQLHHYLKEAYQELGFQIVTVPVLPPEERMQFILDNL